MIFLKPLKDLLQVSATGGVNHYLSDGNTYNHEYTNWFYRGDLSFVYKKVMLAFQIQSNWNWFWGENVYGGENYHLLQAKYNMKPITSMNLPDWLWFNFRGT